MVSDFVSSYACLECRTNAKPGTERCVGQKVLKAVGPNGGEGRTEPVQASRKVPKARVITVHSYPEELATRDATY
jgi:hypothetical protein